MQQQDDRCDKLTDVVGRTSTVGFRSTGDDRQFITLSVHTCRTKLTTLAAIDLPWRNLSSEIGTKFHRDGSSRISLQGSVACKIDRSKLLCQNPIQSVIAFSIELRLVTDTTDRPTDTG